jgi:integrase
MWTIYSMLRSTLELNDGVDIGAFPKVKAFLKRGSAGQQAKKSAVFTRANIDQFLRSADDEQYLHIKVVALFSLFGACRKSEILALTIDDISDAGVHLLVSIRESKTGPRTFIIVASEDPSLNALHYYRKYLLLRQANSPARIFLGYRNGKCIRQPIGRNMIATYPRMIAGLLNLPNPTSFTSHAFRRSSATWMADSGVDMLNLKRFGGWKSDTSAQGYIAESVGNKKRLAETLQADSPKKIVDIQTTVLANSSPVAPPINIAMCNDCTFNIIINEKGS